MHPRLLALIAPVALAWSASAALAASDPIMRLDQVQPGMDCTAQTVVQGTTITSFDVRVISVVNSPGAGPRILVRVSGPAVDTTGVAEGFSGSPVYCPDGTGVQRNAGAISESIGQAGDKVVLVTPIEQMLGEPVTPPSSAPRLTARARPLLGPLTVSGLSPWLLALLQRSGARAGRTVLATPVGPLLPFAPQPLIPGASVAATYSEGAIQLGAVGTVTYRDGQNVYAFGHELDGAGRRSLMMQDAYVYDVIDSQNLLLGGSYKLAAPGHTEGVLTSDTTNAVIGEVGSSPTLIPVHVAARDLDSGAALALRTEVADETDIGLPLGSSLIDTVAPLSVAQLATQIFNGAPASQSGTMCFRVDIRESRTPLKFCDRYVGTGGAGDNGLVPPELASAAGADVASGLGLLDAVQFARLHVTRVIANLNVSRGLAQASILGAQAPVSVHAGQAVRVRLKVRLVRGPAQTLPFRLVIPRDASGALSAVVNAPANNGSNSSSGDGAAGLGAALAGSLSGAPPPPPGPVPGSLAQLTKDFAELSRYDGLSVRFSAPGGNPHGSIHAYRDPKLLITGRATLRFVVG